MKWQYFLEPGGDKVLEISIGGFLSQKKTTVRLNGQLIHTFPNPRELERGQVLPLPDGTALTVERFNNKVRVLQNDQPLPAISSEPHSIIYFIAGLNIVLGILTQVFQVESLRTLGFGILSIAIGIILFVLGYFAQRRSLIALIMAMIIFGLEGVGVLFRGFEMLLTAFNAGTSLHMLGEILQNEALLVGGLAGWTGIYISWLILMVKGVIEITAVRKKMPSKLPAINTILSRGLALIVLVGFIVLSAGIYYLYVPQIYHIFASQGQNKSVVDGPSLDERNAAAGAAVAYESGAGFVQALEQAGVPCVKQTVTPLTVPSSLGSVHVADSVGCMYSDEDYVNAFVARPSEIGRKYFSEYFEHYMQAQSETDAQSLTLKGELWFATAPADQRLFDTQEALGGQLVEP